MRVLLLVSAFNGLSQRVWCALRESGHDVGVVLATSAADMIAGVRAAKPDLILCPYLTHRVPAEVWKHWRTIIIHPGPVGDRGPSSLDWAITDGLPAWGVTALQAEEEMDAGPIWATRTFPLPVAPPRKSSLYNGPVADAALECVYEVLEKAADPGFTPVPTDRMPTAVPGSRLRPPMRPADRAFEWDDRTETILRKIRAADGAPGVRTEVAGLPVYAYDAHVGLVRGARPGTVLGRRQGAVLVGTGDGSLWLGHLRAAEPDGIKLPATTLLGRRLRDVPQSPLGAEPELAASYRQVRYRRTGAVGWLAFDFYNGAMSAGHCRRLLTAFRHAAAQDTQVLVLRGGADAYSNGIHLNLIEAAADPATAAWANIRAINTLCREIIECGRQVVIAAYAGNAGAGGAMMGLGADVVAARAGIVLNPYYDMGLYGSELHTYTLPRRVGPETAHRLIDGKLPVGADQARALGLVDEVGPRHPEAYAEWLAALAESYADPRAARARRREKTRRLAAERVPLEAYEARELAEMSRDLFGDRSGFAAARHAFVTKAKPTETPARLRLGAAVPVVAGPDPAGGGKAPAPAARNRSSAVRPAIPVSA
jgi:putative two-component system protein, hydrogenase maturation factor HypX/HoxX